MFGGAFKKKACPIGVDVGAHTVRLMQLERLPDAAGGGYRAVAAGSAPLDDRGAAFGSDDYHRAVAKAMVTALEVAAEGGTGVTGKRVVSALPASSVQCKNLRLPKMPARDLQSAVEWEASDRLQLAAEPYSVQYLDAGEVQQGEESRQEVILLASPTGFVERHVQTLSECGLDPVAVEVAPAALTRCLSAQPQDDDDTTARVVVDMGYAASKVLILRGDQVLFFKPLEMGGRQFDQIVARQLNLPETEVAQLRRRMPDAGAGAGEPLKDHIRRAIGDAMRPVIQDLGREIGLCLRYYSVTFRGRRPEQVDLIGGESAHDWLASMLTEHAGVEVRCADPLGGVDLSAIGSAVAGDGPAAWAVAAGLSMRPETQSRRQGVAA